MTRLSNNRRVLTVALSIDFDFFIREKIEWDWGHAEARTGLNDVLWAIRYGDIDIYKETDIETHADFAPERLTLKLMRRGLSFIDGLSHRRVGVADSHKHAYNFLKASMPRPDVVVNIDAHHDCWTFQGPKVECDNWVTALRYEWPATQFIQIYPNWKDPRDDGPPQRRADRLQSIDPDNWKSMRGDEWKGFDRQTLLGDIFVCRSSTWVPPHHDARFIDLVKSLLGWGKLVELEPLHVRSAPTQEEAAARYAEQRALIQSMRQQRTPVEPSNDDIAGRAVLPGDANAVAGWVQENMGHEMTIHKDIPPMEEEEDDAR